MTADQLHEIGERLFGRNWQTALANELGVNARTVRRWAKHGVTRRSTELAIRAIETKKRTALGNAVRP